jgi:hypothetical protein
MVDARYEQVRVDNLVRDCAVLISQPLKTTQQIDL